MRIVIDLDGTICEIKKPNQNYADLLPLPGAAQKIHELRATGHYIIIHTARNMATCESNLGKLMKNVGLITLEWLQKHAIEYDEIYSLLSAERDIVNSCVKKIKQQAVT